MHHISAKPIVASVQAKADVDEAGEFHVANSMSEGFA